MTKALRNFLFFVAVIKFYHFANSPNPCPSTIYACSSFPQRMFWQIVDVRTLIIDFSIMLQILFVLERFRKRKLLQAI